MCNGYDTRLEEVCPFSAALAVRRHDIIDLVLAWGATPSQACAEQIPNPSKMRTWTPHPKYWLDEDPGR
jgi:hypothetical protein